ncbi:MAG: site-2 protease family protein [Endomicrobium sp.]|jgi:Zn-dependent protease|nr:site-2 protease family protein [Endomicrobium sp.]
MDGLEIFIYVVVLLFSVIIHETAHAVTANFRGDDTAKRAGRITLNPLPHIDLFGSIILPAVLIIFQSPLLFGWAKPVPVNYANLKNPKFDSALVSAAGPLSNAFLAVAAGLLIRGIKAVPSFEQGVLGSLTMLLSLLVTVNVILLILNLIPVPPLDGSKIAAYFMPEALAFKYLNLHPAIYFVFLIIILSTDFLWKIIAPFMKFFIKTIVGG